MSGVINVYSPTGWAARYEEGDKTLPVEFFTADGNPMVYDVETNPRKLMDATNVSGFERLVQCIRHQGVVERWDADTAQ